MKMMTEQNHIIYRQFIELEFYNQKEDFFLQNKIAGVIKERLMPAIENLFDAETASGKKIKIDSLKIDLGNINKKGWEENFINQTISDLKQKLNEITSFISANDVYEVIYNKDKAVVSSKRSIDEFIENLNVFLQSGLLPWNATHLTASALLNSIINQAANNITAAQKEKLLHSIFYSDETLKRFLYQFTDDELLDFFHKILQFKNVHKVFNLYKKQFLDDTESYKTKIAKWISVLHQFKTEIKINNDVLFSVLNKNVNDETKSLLQPQKKINNNNENFINNAGLIILANFLQQFFINLGLCNKIDFISAEKQIRAILLTQYLITSEIQIAEHDLLLNKIICGFPVNETLPAEFIPTAEEKEQCEELLQSVLEYWKELKTTNTQTLCNTYILRNGKLTDENDFWLLQVEHKAHDVMLQFLPWSIGIIYLPWMQKRLMVEWN
jgi:hypothetical protein